jgi:hypothetical protein
MMMANKKRIVRGGRRVHVAVVGWIVAAVGAGALLFLVVVVVVVRILWRIHFVPILSS